MSRLLIQCQNLTKSFHGTVLFENISLSLHEGEIYALIGENGAGKTTLLQLLRGEARQDQGQIHISKNVRIGFLPQEVESSPLSVRAYLEYSPLQDIEQKMQRCLKEGHLLEWEKWHEKYESLGGYERMPIEQVLQGLKLSDFLDVSMNTLSSGQKVRVALAKALMQNPDLLMLDEPTNHLDASMLSWLEEVLQKRKGATIVISHDRKFLNACCNRLIEIKERKLNFYQGSYNDYLIAQDHLLKMRIKAYEAQEKEKKELVQEIKALTFAKKKPPPPKDSNIIGSYSKRGEKHQKSIQRTLQELKDRLEEINRNPLSHPKPKTIKGLRFDSPPLSSSVVIVLEDVQKSFSEKTLFSHINKTLHKNERIILKGDNGSGKTTLFKCILGIVPIDEGHIHIAPSAKIAYLDQEAEMPMEVTPATYFEKTFQLSQEDLLKELHKAALGGFELIHRPFSALSTGQRKRMKLLALILEKPNVLLLDEPTNHLDLLTIEALEKALLDFEGAILAISHDQTFIEKIATDTWTLT